MKKYSKKQITQHVIDDLSKYSEYFLIIWYNIRSDDSNFRLTDEGYNLLVKKNIVFYSCPINIKLTLKSISNISARITCPFYLDLGKNKIHVIDQNLGINLILLEDVKSFLDFQDSVDRN